jgi:acetyl esterase/lipase
MPVMLHVGDWELLRDDSVTIAQRMREAGVDVELKVWPGMVHCWQLFAPMLDEGMQSLREISAFITRHCASS